MLGRISRLQTTTTTLVTVIALITALCPCWLRQLIGSRRLDVSPLHSGVDTGEILW